MQKQFYYVATAQFEAARQLPNLPDKHHQRQLHGHSFVAKIYAPPSSNWQSFPADENGRLKQSLQQVLAPLNYAYLNNTIATPSDENLAFWLRSQFAADTLSHVSIQSTDQQGVDLDQDNRLQLWRRYRFEAAHQLPNVPAGHQCGRMHGHGFEVIIHARQDLNDNNNAMNFEVIDRSWQSLHEQLHLSCLNDIPGLENPTSELLAAWIWDRLSPELTSLSWVTVHETKTSGCRYDGKHYRIWKQQYCESACRLTRVADKDLRRYLHGHSYLVRLHLSSALDAVMGWTVDYGDVKELFKPVYQQLDHHLLNDLPGVVDLDLASLANWIAEQMQKKLPQLDRIDLFETPDNGIVMNWGQSQLFLPA